MGIDPGLGRVGFGLLEIGAGGSLTAPHWGIIATSKDKTDAQRLQEIYRDLTELVEAMQPDMAVVERLFFFRNVSTAIPVAQARGVVLLVCQNFGLPIHEYTPMQVKQAITGYGKSEKREVQEMLVQVLNLPKKPTPDDAADAVAMAFCHYQHHGRFQIQETQPAPNAARRAPHPEGAYTKVSDQTV